MPNEKDILPPYLAFKTFRSAIQDLRVHGLPQTLDRTAWGNKSGSDQSQIMNSLKFLGLIDDRGNALPALQHLVELSEDSEDERSMFDVLVREAYGEVFKLDLKNATPKQLEDAIGSYGVAGIIKNRAVRFFLKAASHASVPLSTRLTKNMRERNADEIASLDNPDTGERSNGKPRRRRRMAAIQPPPSPPNPQPDLPSNAIKTIHLPNVGGTLTISGTCNAFLLIGEERDLVFQIIDLMAAYEQKQISKPGVDRKEA